MNTPTTGFPVTAAMVVAVSDAFSELLTDDMTACQLIQIIRENRVQRAAGNMGVCASHTFCDANMVMLEAMENEGHKHYSEDEAPAYARSYELLWNQAWDRAKFLEFLNGTI